MNFNNLSVRRKLWALILGLIIALVVVLGSLLTYLQNLNASVSQELALMQKRATLSTQWHGMVSLDATRLVVQMGTSDEAMSQLMDQEMGTAAITEVQKQVVALVNTPKARHCLKKLLQHGNRPWAPWPSGRFSSATRY